MSNLNITPLWRPDKITWVYQNPDPNQVLDRIQTKSGRKFLRSLEQIKLQYNISFEIGPCTEHEYLQWLELYFEITEAKKFRKPAQPEWYAQKIAENKQIEKVFLYQNGFLLGGKIISISKDNIVRSAFKITRPYEFGKEIKNGSLGLMLDYVFLQHYSKQYKHITGGRSQNLFGIFNKIGYLNFKLRIGYSAKIEIADNNFSQVVTNKDDMPFCSFLTTDPTQNSFPQLYSYRGEELLQNDFSESKKLIPISELSYTQKTD